MPSQIAYELYDLFVRENHAESKVQPGTIRKIIHNTMFENGTNVDPAKKDIIANFLCIYADALAKKTCDETERDMIAGALTILMK